MNAIANVELLRDEPMSLVHLSDAELLTQTRALVGRSRQLDPLPPVAARIEPLGPAPGSLAPLVPPGPTWDQFVDEMNPVRELEVGERPREWGLADDDSRSDSERFESTSRAVGSSGESLAYAGASTSAADGTALETNEIDAPARVTAESRDALPVPQRYKVQFTATEEYVQLVDEAKALLSHSAPRVSLEEVQLRAMRHFVEALRKRKYGTDAPAVEAEPRDSQSRPRGQASTHGQAAPPQPSSSIVDKDCTQAFSGDTSPPPPANESARSSAPRQRARHIPAAIRRAVAARDGHRCTYADASGRRCSETRRLEFHHVVPFAVSPVHEVSNLTLRCAAHNALAAEQDFGHKRVHAKKAAARHESFAQQRSSRENVDSD